MVANDGGGRDGWPNAYVEIWLDTLNTKSVRSIAGLERVGQDIPVMTPLPCALSSLSRASRRIGRPLTVIEHRPSFRTALQVKPIVATVAAERNE